MDCKGKRMRARGEGSKNGLSRRGWGARTECKGKGGEQG